MADPAQTSTSAASEPKSAEDGDFIVCRTMDPPTGTRLGARRECRPKREWNAIQEQSKKDVTDIQANQHALRTTGMGGG